MRRTRQPPPETRPALVRLILTAALLSASCGQRPQTAAKAEPTPQAAAPSASPIPWKTVEPPAQVGGALGAPKPKQSPHPVRIFTGTGVVNSINLKEGWFEIDHEEIKGYMPAMRMQWSVRDRSLLKSVQAGDRVDFTLEENNGSEVVTGLKKAAAAR